MQTYSHLILTAALNHVLKDKADIPIHSTAFLFGSFAPDVALGLLSAGFVIDRRLKKLDQIWCGDEFNAIFFNDPRWILSHNLLHAPLLLLLLTVTGAYVGARLRQTWGWSLFWFALGCAFHSSLDLLTHHDDGPLIWFPFDWKTRFQSRFSYWDRQHGAALFAPLEHLLDLALLVYFMIGFVRKQQQK